MARLLARLTGGDRRFALAMATLGFLCALPSLRLGMSPLDDPSQRAFILEHLDPGAKPTTPWYDAYNLASGDAALAETLRSQWVVPWWTWPRLKIRFFRPLATATLYLDYALFGDRLWLAHLHSALWYGVLCFAMALLALRFTRDRSVALLGALWYAVDDSHTSPSNWLAGRNALIAATFAALSLLAYDRSCRERSRRRLCVALGCFALALLSAENAVSALPWFLAHALYRDHRPWPQRLGSLTALGALSVGWAAMHHAMGFGSYGSGAYLDPVSELSPFLAQLLPRYGQLLHAQFMAPWNLQEFIPLTVLLWIDVIQFLGLSSALIVQVACNVTRDRDIAFWTLCAVLGLVPLTAAPPDPRLLTHTGIAFCLLLSSLVIGAIRNLRCSGAALRWPGFAALGGVLAVNLLLSPAALMRGHVLALPGAPPDAPVFDLHSDWRYRDLVLINVPNLPAVFAVAEGRRERKLPLPARTLVLGTTDQAVEVKRIDAQTLELYSPLGYLIDISASYWRGPSVPFRPGEQVHLDSVDIEILSLTPDLRPLRIRARFARPLEDPSLLFAVWNGAGLEKMLFPPIGERRIILYRSAG